MNTNPVTEISLAIVSSLLIIAAAGLLYLGKIDFTQVTLILGLVAGLWGVNTAFKAPSPGQQETLQQLVSQLISSMTPPTPARPITSNAYIPPEIKQQLPRGGRVVDNTLNVAAPQQVQVATPFPVAGTATSVQVPTGGNPVFPDLTPHFGDTGVVPTIPPQS